MARTIVLEPGGELFDLTSTYFEVDGPKAPESALQRHGYSRDKRGDCLQVVVAL